MRRQLWEALDHAVSEEAWMLFGHFNCALRGEERRSGQGVSSAFVDWVEQRILVDIGFSRSLFTWSHGSSVDTRRVARLDRVLCDKRWNQQFSTATVRHLPHAYSNHCPLLLNLDPGSSFCLGARLFKFQADGCGIVIFSVGWVGNGPRMVIWLCHC